jgi:hypothetical protein
LQLLFSSVVKRAALLTLLALLAPLAPLALLGRS